MTGKTYTNQDLTLGCVITQEIPVQAMLGFEKQLLIDNKALTRDILTLALSDVSDLRDAKKHLDWVQVWSSEQLAVDPFAGNPEIDEVRLGFRIDFTGLTPAVTASLRFFVSQPNGIKYVIRMIDWECKDNPFSDTELSISCAQLLTVPFSKLFAAMVGRVVERIKQVQILDFQHAWEHEDNEYTYAFQTTIGNFSFYD
jgi:hypothetical protein